MKKFCGIIIVGISIAALGLIIVVLTSSQNVPPVDVSLNESGLVSIGGVYFDQIFLHNHGSQNVTVVVEIKNELDNGPRLSDPVQICPGCTTTVLVEEHQPPQDPDQADVFTNIVLNPDYVRVEYLSVFLATPITFDVLRQIGWILLATGSVVIVCGLRLSNCGGPKQVKRTAKRPRRFKE